MRRVLVGLVLVVAIPVGMTGWDVTQAVRLRQRAVERCVRPQKRLTLEGRPWLRGKLGVIDVAQNKWDPPIGSRLPPDLLPARAEEIGTCVLLEWGAKAEGLSEVTQGRGGQGQGSSPALARRGTCKVTLIDLAEGAIIAEELLYGPSPADGSAPGTRPITEVEDWLLKLPRR